MLVADVVAVQPSAQTNLPLPPVVFLVTTTLPLAELAKLQVAVAPASTVTVTLGLVPGGEPGAQLARSKTNPGSTVTPAEHTPELQSPSKLVRRPLLDENVADMVTLLRSV